MGRRTLKHPIFSKTKEQGSAASLLFRFGLYLFFLFLLYRDERLVKNEKTAALEQ